MFSFPHPFCMKYVFVHSCCLFCTISHCAYRYCLWYFVIRSLKQQSAQVSAVDDVLWPCALLRCCTRASRRKKGEARGRLVEVWLEPGYSLNWLTLLAMGWRSLEQSQTTALQTRFSRKGIAENNLDVFYISLWPEWFSREFLSVGTGIKINVRINFEKVYKREWVDCDRRSVLWMRRCMVKEGSHREAELWRCCGEAWL